MSGLCPARAFRAGAQVRNLFRFLSNGVENDRRAARHRRPGLFSPSPLFETSGLDAYLNRQQALIDGFAAAGVPVVQVFHVEDEGVFALASGHVRTLEPLRISPAAIFHKRRHSALVGSGLDVWLTRHGVRRLAISGIRTEQCCETTTRHASDLGYEVDYVAEATLTFPMTDAAGRRWSAEEIRARTELVLAGRFARVVDVAGALAGLAEKAAA